MTTRSVRLALAALLLAAVLTCIGCSPQENSSGVVAPPSPAAAASSAPAVAPATLFVPPAHVHLDYLLYLPEAPADPRPLLRTLVAKEGPELTLVDTQPGTADTRATLWVDDSAQLIADAPAPDADALRYLGKDLSDTQVAQVVATRHAILLRFEHPAATARAALARADRITLALARQIDAFITDSEARWTYSAASWQALRFTAEGAARLDVRAQVAVHSYRDGEQIRSVSVGMQKFALPDLAMEGLSQSTGRALGWILVGLLQRLLEGQRPDADGTLAFDVRAIADADVRKAIKDEALPNATWQGRFGLTPAPLKDGDADNALLTVAFDDFEGIDDNARRAAAAGQVMGWTDSLKMVDHDAALDAASARARARLPQLRNTFRAGLAAGASLIVKAPFAKADGGAEWMWVEVTAWDDTQLRGILTNEPYFIADLHRGQQVEVAMDDVFDYILSGADGTREGGETNDIIERMQGEVRKQGAE